MDGMVSIRAGNDNVLAKVYGKTLNEAIDIIVDLRFVPRVTREDDVYYVCTRDYRRDRINLEIEKGIVKGASYG